MAIQLEEFVLVNQTPAPASSASLVGGLITDVQSLVRQEIALVRQETLEDLGRLRSAALTLVPAVVLFALGSVLLGFALAQGAAALLHWPAWAGYAGIGAILAGAGYFLFPGFRRGTSAVKEVSRG